VASRGGRARRRGVAGPARPAEFEFLRLVEDDEGVVYLASPGGRPATPFRLIEAGERSAVFGNPDLDFPKRLEYRLVEGHLIASVSGDVRSQGWTFERVGDVE
jgi:hypothetical protein